MLRLAGRFPARAGRCAKDVSGKRTYQASRPNRGPGEGDGDGISQVIEYSGLWGAITTFPRRKPFATNVIIATVKTSCADLVVQKIAEGKDEVDWVRNAGFTAFGFAYLGIGQWCVYVTLFSKLFPNTIRFANMPWAAKLKDKAGQIDLLKQTAFDNFIHYTFMYFPVFYVIKEGINRLSANNKASNKDEQASLWPHDLVASGLGKYWKNCVTDNMYMWALWIPGDLIVYSVPIWMRLPLNHCISLVWTMILSNLRGSEK
ncbi:unnamed protein product [Polarella glacialis]|uniref:Uncharacterized protein n=2 Tax=Polarella glacialis TaxID=89957 RepID=A0A813M1K7_POLGL|nr:unnamed protein product [Polarella glacialis]|mmetsp:Transcript_44594/g.80743  ORF Transcript_44594/g.80743 Transcript_44594/m.80743 type:complete len:260 (+) Transcript_44594:71-850(+)